MWSGLAAVVTAAAGTQLWLDLEISHKPAVPDDVHLSVPFTWLDDGVLSEELEEDLMSARSELRAAAVSLLPGHRHRVDLDTEDQRIVGVLYHRESAQRARRIIVDVQGDADRSWHFELPLGAARLVAGVSGGPLGRSGLQSYLNVQPALARLRDAGPVRLIEVGEALVVDVE